MLSIFTNFFGNFSLDLGKNTILNKLDDLECSVPKAIGAMIEQVENF
ncbi:hypothetical protein RintRC_1726 [Richelia intracellularis]|nr:hypothetical protein RintRC_1726 [Richelia intracellularis]